VPLNLQLISAYQKAFYIVRDGPVLRIGERNAGLESLLRMKGAASAAFITAANPQGVQRSEAANQAAMAALEASLRWPFLSGEGRDPEGRWPDEPSLLVLGIPRAEAEALGRSLEQNAIVFVEQGGAPQLVLLRKMRLVLDTQVWIDWLVFEDPAVAAIRQALAAEQAEIFINAACAAELERVLSYPLGRRTLAPAARASRLAACLGLTRMSEETAVENLPLCRDPDDQKFLQLAAAVKADCLVTRDRALLVLRRRCAGRFAILEPKAF
jgi:putative PIN family toxin of toxin-antitoxin system